ncbi:hypothetical protein BaRGS_00003336 [Batillaria attramentaria]|uniref:Uncharacterized protein n=1 Tax=Batillaria attramentaria TaxID=370345 RepID=A0ABD0M2S6_9CAEN
MYRKRCKRHGEGTCPNIKDKQVGTDKEIKGRIGCIRHKELDKCRENEAKDTERAHVQTSKTNKWTQMGTCTENGAKDTERAHV